MYCVYGLLALKRWKRLNDTKNIDDNIVQINTFQDDFRPSIWKHISDDNFLL